jgi:hypothetical protein
MLSSLIYDVNVSDNISLEVAEGSCTQVFHQ